MARDKSRVVRTLFFLPVTVPLTSFPMTSFHPLLMITVIAAFLASCTGNAPVSSSTSLAPTESLAAYKTFGWSANRVLSLRDPNRNTAEAKGWIDSSMESGFTDKGLIKTDAASADVLIGYAVGSRSMHSSQTFTDEGELNQSQLQEGRSYGRSATLYSDYEQGRLFLTVTDRKTGKVVYRGTSEAALFDQPSGRKSQSRLQKAVKKMLKNWPNR